MDITYITQLNSITGNMVFQKRPEIKVEPEKKVDSVEISSGAKKENTAVISKLAMMADDLRAEKIVEIQRKLASGYYNTEESLESIANAVLRAII